MSEVIPEDEDRGGGGAIESAIENGEEDIDESGRNPTQRQIDEERGSP